MFKQETYYNCGPTCLQIVWALCGREPLPQSAFAAMARTDTTGTSVWGLKRALKAMGLRFEVRKGKGSLRSPRLHTAIVYDPKRDHWMVAHGQGNTWALYDPETGLTQDHTRSSIRAKVFGRWDSYSLFVFDKE